MYDEKLSILYIAPAEAQTHDLPHTRTSLQARSPTPYSFGHREAVCMMYDWIKTLLNAIIKILLHVHIFLNFQLFKLWYLLILV